MGISGSGHSRRSWTCTGTGHALRRGEQVYERCAACHAIEANRIDLFLLPYLGAHVLYLGRTGLIVLWRLGR